MSYRFVPQIVDWHQLSEVTKKRDDSLFQSDVFSKVDYLLLQITSLAIMDRIIFRLPTGVPICLLFPITKT